MQCLRDAVVADQEYIDLLGAIQEGAPLKKAAMFSNILDELHVEDNLLFWGRCIVVLYLCHPEVLEALHSFHQGIEKIKRRARQSVYWLGVNSDITNVFTLCRAC